MEKLETVINNFVGDVLVSSGYIAYLGPFTVSLNSSIQRCQTRNRVIPYILHYKVYNSSCHQVGHNLIDRVQYFPEQIKATASVGKHILWDDGSALCSGVDALMQ